MSRRDLRHADRRGLPPWLLASLLLAVAGACGIAGQVSAQGRLTPMAGLLAGMGIATLAILGLPSLSVRLVARVLLFVAASVMVRFGLLTGSIAVGGQLLLAWLVAAVAVLVLSDRVGTAASPAMGGELGRRPSAAIPATGRAVIVVAAVTVVAAVLLAPVVLPHIGRPTEAGEGANLDPLRDGARAIRSTDSLDMTRRPSLTEEVVLTVEADRPAFWRGETFDRWDGRRWTRSDEGAAVLQGGQVVPDPLDLGAFGSDVLEQRITVEAPYVEVVFGAPSMVEVEIDRPAAQRPDGTVLTTPLGQGATYTVSSRRPRLSAEVLRAAQGDVPEQILEQYAQPPVMTDRVRSAALDATAGATTTYDKVRAIEEWMGARTEYSLDAPLAPRDVDVVDHFLFESRLGWCEQVASSFVVLARANGIPARLVTGFVPGERDSVTGVFTVRERDLHAWTEVWFPEVGWVGFDPTADVPLAGEEPATDTWGGWLRDRLVVILLAGAVIAVLVGPVRRWLAGRLAARRARPSGWPQVAEQRFEMLAGRWGVPRDPAQTLDAVGRALAQATGDARLARAGTVVDGSMYAHAPPGADEQAWVDEVLTGAEALDPQATSVQPAATVDVGSPGP